MRRTRALSTCVLAIVLAACAAAPTSARKPWTVTEADAGRSIRVPVGTLIDVALPGNPSTGFIWQRAAGEAGGLEAAGAARFEPAGPAVGQGGLVRLAFRVTKAGATPLWLVYRRPFEASTPPARTFSVTIVGEAD